MPGSTLLQRLRERKLVQWAIAYLAGAWVIYEATGTALEAWNIPTLLIQSVHILLLFGLPLTLVLAWYHGEKGRQRVSGPELLIIALLLLISGGVLSMLRRGKASGEQLDPWVSVAAGDDRPSVAVLPCDNLSADPADTYLASALHDEILLKLQGIASLFSTGRASVEWYKENPAPLSQVARELGVGFVGECSVQKYGDQIRLIFQLLDGRSGGQVWADDFDRDLTTGDLFDIQREVAQQVARGIGAVLTPEERAQVEKVPTGNLVAYDYYLRGNEYRWRGWENEDLRIAEEMYRAAIDLDPNFALAYAKLSLIHSSLYWFFHDRSEGRLRAAGEAADKALELDPDLPEAHQALGIHYYYGFRDYARATAEVEIALGRQPNNASLFMSLAAVQRRQGDFEAGYETFLRAAAHNPLFSLAYFEAGVCAFHLRDYPNSERLLRKSLSLSPGFPEAELLSAWREVSEMGDVSTLEERVRAVLRGGTPDRLTSLVVDEQPWWVLRAASGDLARDMQGLSAEAFGADTMSYLLMKAELHERLDQPEVAKEYFDSVRVAALEGVEAWPQEARYHSLLGVAHAGLGEPESALREALLAVDLLPKSTDPLWGRAMVDNLVWVQLRIGQFNQALDGIESLLSGPGPLSVAWIRVDPLYDPIRENPRFQALMERYAGEVDH